MLSRKIPKLKLDLKSKGRSRYILLHKYLLPGIPVLSIFALMGIIICSFVCVDKLADSSSVVDLANLILPSESNKAYAEEDITPLATPETIGDSTASITIGGAGKEEVVSAGRGSVVYRTHDISMAGSNVRNYTLSIYGDSSLKYVGGGSSNDVLTSAGGVTGKTMNDSTTYDNTWGYAYGDSTTSNDSLTYKAPTGSTIGTAETLASGTIASSANGVLSISNKKLVFAAKFGEDKPQGNYRANVNLALTITPRVLTTYSITYDCKSGQGCPATLNTTSYDDPFIYTIPATPPTKNGYTFLGYSSSKTATTADANYAPGKLIQLSSSTPERKFYAVWQTTATISNVTTMQQLSASICKNTAIGTSKTLRDARGANQQSYTIRKLADGNCWMVENLRLPASTTITAQDSDLDPTVFGNTSYTLPSNNTGNFSTDNTVQQVRNSTNNTYGAYYSWCAATANTCKINGTPITSGNASSSICPKGWKLPIYSGNGSYHNLATMYSSNQISSAQRILVGASTEALGGMYLPAAGYVAGSGLDSTTRGGNYWARSSYNLDNAQYISFHVDAIYTSDAVNKKYHGFSVRCVLSDDAEGAELNTTSDKTLSSLSTMQEIEPTICSNSSTGETAILKDTRGGGYTNNGISNSYAVKKAADGNCWMTQNLRIISGTASTTDSDLASGSFSISQAVNDKKIYDGGTTYGAYYSWNAATAGSNQTSGEASSSICPKGWKLPRGGEDTNNDYARSLGITATITRDTNYWNNLNNPIFTNSILTVNGLSWQAAGYASSTTVSEANTVGYYWSRSTCAFGGNARANSLTIKNGSVQPATCDGQQYSYSIRCVAYSS